MAKKVAKIKPVKVESKVTKCGNGFNVKTTIKSGGTSKTTTKHIPK